MAVFHVFVCFPPQSGLIHMSETSERLLRRSEFETVHRGKVDIKVSGKVNFRVKGKVNIKESQHLISQHHPQTGGKKRSKKVKIKVSGES